MTNPALRPDHRRRNGGVPSRSALLRAALLAACLLSLLAVARTHPAHAQFGLTASTPAAGSTIDTAPTSLTLTFSDALKAAPDSWIQVQHNNRDLVVDAASLDGDTNTSLSADLYASGDGIYVVNWVVSAKADGSTASGSYEFFVGVPLALGGDASAGPTSMASSSPSFALGSQGLGDTGGGVGSVQIGGRGGQFDVVVTMTGVSAGQAFSVQLCTAVAGVLAACSNIDATTTATSSAAGTVYFAASISFAGPADVVLVTNTANSTEQYSATVGGDWETPNLGNYQPPFMLDN